MPRLAALLATSDQRSSPARAPVSPGREQGLPPAPGSIGGIDQVLLAGAMEFPGAAAAALVDRATGTILGVRGEAASLPHEIVSGNAPAVQGKVDLACSLCAGAGMDDRLKTTGEQIHLIRPLAPDHRLVLFLAVDKARTNLGLKRAGLADLERGLTG